MVHRGNVGVAILSGSASGQLAPFTRGVKLSFVDVNLGPLPFNCLHTLGHLGAGEGRATVINSRLFASALKKGLINIGAVLLAPVGPRDSLEFHAGHEMRTFVVGGLGVIGARR